MLKEWIEKEAISVSRSMLLIAYISRLNSKTKLQQIYPIADVYLSIVQTSVLLFSISSYS